jgi:carbon-monoxide dehydrogenase large subunit
VEDGPLITGSGCYVADVTREGQVWARVVRSPVAHGRLVRVDLAAVRAHPGVIAAVSAADIPGIESLRIPCRLHPPPQAQLVTQPPLAVDRVRYVGEPLAVVLAADPYVAEDAAAATVTEIEELPAVLDPVAAAGPEASVLHPQLGHNTAGAIVCRHGAGVDGLFHEADAVVSERLIMHRHSAVPMETRGLVAELGADGRLTVWGPTKVKHHNRAMLAELLGIEERRIRFIEPDVGGSFGTRGEFYPEDFLIPWLSLRLGRPVKWIEDRTENFVASNHSRERVYEIEMCARSDGTLLALRSSEWCGLGGYLRTAGLTVPEISVRHLAGPYRWEAFEATSYGVLTNKTPIGTYRGPGEAEATFARERMLDLLADELALDPAGLRLQNLIRPADLPHRLEFGSGVEPVVYESGDFPCQLQTLLDHVGYRELRDRTASARSAGERVGLGIACFIGEGSYGPFEWARVVAEADGSFTGYVGAASFGQGLRTALRQILADALDVPVERVRIHHHDTDLVAEGVGSWADRTTALAVGALLEATPVAPGSTTRPATRG